MSTSSRSQKRTATNETRERNLLDKEMWATDFMYSRRETMYHVGNPTCLLQKERYEEDVFRSIYEDAEDKDDWILRIKQQRANPG